MRRNKLNYSERFSPAPFQLPQREPGEKCSEG